MGIMNPWIIDKIGFSIMKGMVMWYHSWSHGTLAIDYHFFCVKVIEIFHKRDTNVELLFILTSSNFKYNNVFHC